MSGQAESFERATFGGGCFWGPELLFARLPGVLQTQVGYSQGTVENATYEDVCSGLTGHNEVVQVIFLPSWYSTLPLKYPMKGSSLSRMPFKILTKKLVSTERIEVCWLCHHILKNVLIMIFNCPDFERLTSSDVGKNSKQFLSWRCSMHLEINSIWDRGRRSWYFQVSLHMAE